MRVESSAAEQRLADRFHQWCVLAVARLPMGLKRVVAPTFLGFVVLNGCTYAVDLVLLSGLHAGLGVPLPVAVTVAYACAFALSYYLNRTMNFQSHASVGPQLGTYVAVVAVNYAAFVLGVSTAATAAGADFLAARILAGCCETAFMYAAMRWVVFRGEAISPGSGEEIGSNRNGAAQAPASRPAYRVSNHKEESP